MKEGLSIILPCYNEEKAIFYVLNDLKNKMQTLENTFGKVEVIVVNDGSTDESKKEISKFDFPILLENKVNAGYGYSIKKALGYVKYNSIALFDMDATINPLNFIMLYETNKLSSLCPMIIGKRMHKKSSMPLVRRIGNSLYMLIILIINFKYVADPCSGMRLYYKNWLLENCKSLPDDLNFTLATTLLCLKHKYPIKDVPIEYYSRIGASKLNEIKHGFKFFSTIINYSFKNFFM